MKGLILLACTLAVAACSPIFLSHGHDSDHGLGTYVGAVVGAKAKLAAAVVGAKAKLAATVVGGLHDIHNHGGGVPGHVGGHNDECEDDKLKKIEELKKHNIIDKKNDDCEDDNSGHHSGDEYTKIDHLQTDDKSEETKKASSQEGDRKTTVYPDGTYVNEDRYRDAAAESNKTNESQKDLHNLEQTKNNDDDCQNNNSGHQSGDTFTKIKSLKTDDKAQETKKASSQEGDRKKTVYPDGTYVDEDRYRDAAAESNKTNESQKDLHTFEQI